MRLPYNVNVLTQAAATFALDHLPHFVAQTAVLIAERTKMVTSLNELFAVHPTAKQFESEANFILIRLPQTHRVEAVLNQLRADNILVKNTSAGHPLLVNTIRITIGTPDENLALLNALKKGLS